ncbi:MAG TPA: HIT family protein [Acidimicrobiales bacterium]|nr:HIT family protein [Acidimicrobiales bacterium]
MTDYPRVPFDVDGYAARVTSGAPCFICRIVNGADRRHEIVYRDEDHIAFLNRFPTLAGYTLVAPVRHLEQVVGQFAEEEYLRLQRLVYRIGRAMSEVLPTERLYVLSLGSQQGNRHVHWHLAPLPPGVPYRDQQLAALMAEHKGYLDIPDADRVRLAATLRAAIADDTRT